MTSRRLLPAGVLAILLVVLAVFSLRGQSTLPLTSQLALFYGCGNGIMESGEECEQGSVRCPQGFSCRSCVCALTSGCGNGVLDQGETCDGTSVLCPEWQSCENCQCKNPMQTCGNGRPEGSEQCENTILASCMDGMTCVNCVCTRGNILLAQPLILTLADGPLRPQSNSVLTHHFKVKNMTNETATQVRIFLSHNGHSPVLDTALTTPGCSKDSNNVFLCNLGSLGPGEESQEITIAFRISGCMGAFLRATSAIARTVMRNQINSQIIRFAAAPICSGPGSVSSRSSVTSVATGSCGNRVLERGETCEVNVCCPGGDACSTDTCSCGNLYEYSSDSSVESYCGNGYLEGNEQCESDEDCGSIVCVRYPCPIHQCNACRCVTVNAGISTDSSPLLAQLSVQSKCGNGILEVGESCEVNVCCADGDPCNAQCQCESTAQVLFSSSSSSSSFSVLNEVCNDGVLTTREDCEADYNCHYEPCDNSTCRCQYDGQSIGSGAVIIDSLPAMFTERHWHNWFMFYPPAQPTLVADANAFGGSYYLFPHTENLGFSWDFPLEMQGQYEFYISEIMSGQPLRCAYHNTNAPQAVGQCAEDAAATLSYRGKQWRKVMTFDKTYSYGPATFRIALTPTGSAGASYKIDAVLIKKQDPPPDPSTLCGNGRLDADESCDDANTVYGDGCHWCNQDYAWSCSGEPSVCRPVCGDTYVVGTEQCDEGRNPPVSGDGCSATCMVENGWTCKREHNASMFDVSTCSTVCGDGIVIALREGCDDGNTANADGCSSNCVPEPGWTCSGAPSTCRTTCGDGIIVGMETCDDNNVRSDDGCSATCTVESGYSCSGSRPSVCEKCGNGRREGREQCDDGNAASHDCCSASCTVEPGCACNTATPNRCIGVCGNRTLEWNEVCDDGNTLAGDGCSDCTSVDPYWECTGTPSVCHKCGNGVIETVESCDDRNLINGDGCSMTCLVESGFTCSGRPSVCYRCGNGRKESTEACDDGNGIANDGCSLQCTVEPGWKCDGSPSVCAGICGDGMKLGVERCDDGNSIAGDGCSACSIDPGWECRGTPSACHKCGNGIKESSELCDDGNTQNGDGCNSTCGIEVGWSCIGTRSICVTGCGDGGLAGSEQCDDRNNTNADGCSAACTVEPGWLCTGIPSLCSTLCGDAITAGTEQCDDGNLLDGDGCSHLCRTDAVIRSSLSSSPVFSESSSSSSSFSTFIQRALCGDGRKEGDEQCERGMPCPQDMICETTTCQCMPFKVTSRASSSRAAYQCGNGIREPDEQCENGVPCQQGICSATCQCLPEPSSTSTSTSSSSSLLPSSFSSSSVRSILTSLPPACGNRMLEGDETCEIGVPCQTGVCSKCHCIAWKMPASSSQQSQSTSVVVLIPSVCGDARAEAAETCDDGNILPGDGCDGSCLTEEGYICFGVPSSCLPVCGDGIQVYPEQCDDGNTFNGDGCSSVCETERFAPPDEQPPPSLPVCGDRLWEGTEECDDGNLYDGDGCSSLCRKEISISSFSSVSSSSSVFVMEATVPSSASSHISSASLPVSVPRSASAFPWWLLVLFGVLLLPIPVIFILFRKRTQHE